MPIRDYASVATKVFHVYCDSAAADDSGNGRSWATAKKTLAAVSAILPTVCESHLVINIKGAHTLTSSITFSTISKGRTNNVLIDGGDEIVVVDGPYMATSATVNTLTDTARSWTVNALRGYAVEILDGAAAGYIYTIQSNTADTITVGLDWPSPGTPQYRITRPATTITGASYRTLNFSGSCDGQVSFQRLRIVGNAYVGISTGGARLINLNFADFIVDRTASAAAIQCYTSSGTSVLAWFKYDPANPGSQFEAVKDRRSTVYLGTGMAVGTPGVTCYQGGCAIYGLSIIYGLLKLLGAPGLHTIGNGSLVRKVMLQLGSVLEIGNNAYYGNSAIIEGSNGIGIDAKDSRVRLTLSAIVRNNASHGIALDNSILDCEGTSVLSGTGNTGAGIYVHSGSKVSYPSGSAPTITGTVGDIAITDPATEDLTWAELDAAGKAVIAAEDVILKKV